jgi:hypothetical protein
MIRPCGARPMTVVLAAIDARATIAVSLDRWLSELGGHGAVLVVDASRDGTADLVADAFPDVRLLRRPPGRLAPELWRDGLEAADSPLIAFSTAQMVPAPGWRRAMLDRLAETGAAVVGGPIGPPASRTSAGLAIYVLRYVHYLPPLIDPERIEPPGDNAVYVRQRLEGLEPLWKEGFWEVEIHRALRARGDRTVLVDGAVVTLEGVGGSFLSLIGQRYAHARHYGASRARNLRPASRLARMAAAPLIPPVLLWRIVAALHARSQSLGPWLSALPCLTFLLAAWSLGEARGMGVGFFRPRRPDVVTSSPTKRLRRVCETRPV